MTSVDFGYNQSRYTGTQLVYVKQTWSGVWVWYQHLHCLEATWCLSPSMPTATLVWDYGYVQPSNYRQYLPASKLSINGYYVKIVLQTNTVAGTSNTWYGVVSHIEDEQWGIAGTGDNARATGQQTFHCYGLEKLLDTEYLSESYVDTGAEAPIVVQLPIGFNRDGRPNMNDRAIGPQNGHVFEGQPFYQEGSLRRSAAWWTTWEICDYLIRWMVPKDSFLTRNKRINWVMVNSGLYLPHYDHPVIEQEGQTVLAVLNRLIDRRRLRSFYVTVDETVTPNNIQLVVVAWNKTTIDTGIEGADIYLGAVSDDRVITLLYDYNQSTTAVLRKAQVARYDRIVVRGARRTTTATFFVDDNMLDLGWSNDAEMVYEEAASDVAGYADWDDLKKRQRNAEVRGSEELSHVYSWFKLPDYWTQHIVHPGGGGNYPAFVDAGGEAVPQDIHEVHFEPFLPLYEHVDYSSDIIGNHSQEEPPIRVYRQLLLVFKVPTDERYVAGDAISTLAEASADQDPDEGEDADGRNWRWSALCRVQPDSRVLEVRVSGEPQHVIAKGDFTPLDDDRVLGDFAFRDEKMLVTATLIDNRYAEGKYPPDGTLDGTLVDEQFGYVIYAGDEYRQDFVVPNTVVDVDTEGKLVKSNGGYVRNDTNLLACLARIAYEWWHQERVILSLQTTQLTSGVQIGHLIDTIGDSAVVNGHYEAVNTVVSELRITWPRIEGNGRDTPMLQFVTGAGELDPMTMMPPRSRVTSRAAARRAPR